MTYTRPATLALIGLTATLGAAALEAQAPPPVSPSPEKTIVRSEQTTSTSERRVVRTRTTGPVSSAPAISGMVAIRDATTGELRAPTAEERLQMGDIAPMLNRSDEGLVETTYSDGSVSVHLDGRFQSAMAVDSHQNAACTHNAHTLTTVVSKTDATPKSTSGREIQ